MITRLNRRLVTLHAVSDSLFGMLAFGLAYVIRFELPLFAAPKGQPPFAQYLILLPFIGLLVPLAFNLQGAYRLPRDPDAGGRLLLGAGRQRHGGGGRPARHAVRPGIHRRPAGAERGRLRGVAARLDAVSRAEHQPDLRLARGRAHRDEAPLRGGRRAQAGVDRRYRQPGPACGGQAAPTPGIRLSGRRLRGRFRGRRYGGTPRAAVARTGMRMPAN